MAAPDDDPHRALRGRLLARIPAARLVDDPLRRLAYGTDASLYRLVPRLVVQVRDEDEVAFLLREAARAGTPVTFRAAGTSLSGQAVTDSVLAVLGPHWRGCAVGPGAATVSLQAGVVGAHANAALAPFRRRIGPDPASLQACMAGGIAANNASGMCCGTEQNSYRTLEALRTVLADGTALDTADPLSRAAFARRRPDLVEGLADLARQVRADAPLADRIRRKYRIKNTTGYSLNALADFADPVDILAHLLIGSEGTLGFISSVTFRTVPDEPFRATALLLFPAIEAACAAVPRLREVGVAAAELMDRASLAAVAHRPGMPAGLAGLGPRAAALLVETRADDRAALERRRARLADAAREWPLLEPAEFTADAARAEALWHVRKGLFPAVGARRAPGTTVVIEDVVFAPEHLAEGAAALGDLLARHGYGDAILFGHALAGNLHFVFSQDFGRDAEVARYDRMIRDVVELVVGRFDGSLKGEHGTGRNMAPFVEREWGPQAVGLMRAVKRLLDPAGLLNPGAILSDDAQAHLRHLKPLPLADPLADPCIECGFCEPTCPSRDVTLTPRQRIVVLREGARLRAAGAPRAAQRAWSAAARYPVDRTCATDGLCALACPVEIDTGRLVKALRARDRGVAARAAAAGLGRGYAAALAGARAALAAAHAARGLLGPAGMARAAGLARGATGGRLPAWNEHVPRGAGRLPRPPRGGGDRPAVVYFPSCVARTFGVSRPDGPRDPLTRVTLRLLDRAGYRVVYPPRCAALCCGLAFASKGFEAEGGRKAAELEAALRAAGGGERPVLFDTSPCLARMRERAAPGLRLHEPAEFALRFLVDRLELTPQDACVAVHATCSLRKLGLEGALADVARRCAREVVVPASVGCCGWAGDRGFLYPELPAAALGGLAAELPPSCWAGYSTSRGCEIGLSQHSGRPYRSILYLLEECSRPAGAEGRR